MSQNAEPLFIGRWCAGAGDRLGLLCADSGEALPAAMLPYCGRPMLEGLLRDLQAREYLHFRIFGTQLTTPIAIMTSDAKGNHRRVSEMLEIRSWFGRPRDSFRLFNQPLVPVLEAKSGEWVLPEPLQPSLKPGGHGAIWKLMCDHQVFEWLEEQGECAPVDAKSAFHRLLAILSPQAHA
jgi:UTP---glucose-1-phosphate uridylyltransferase